MDEREAANRSAADYLARLRQRLADGKSEIQRLRESIDATHEHLAGMSRWIEQTDLQLRDERDRRTSGCDDDE
jgi:septal ring factor EnvC (AmiA/AmiB activator)